MVQFLIFEFLYLKCNKQKSGQTDSNLVSTLVYHFLFETVFSISLLDDIAVLSHQNPYQYDIIDVHHKYSNLNMYTSTSSESIMFHTC